MITNLGPFQEDGTWGNTIKVGQIGRFQHIYPYVKSENNIYYI